MSQRIDDVNSMGRDGLVNWLLGEPGELPAELRLAARAAFETATDAELRDLAGCVLGGGEPAELPERLGELSGRRRLAREARHLRG